MGYLFQCLPWARSFCPFRACGALLGMKELQGVWGLLAEALLVLIQGNLISQHGPIFIRKENFHLPDQFQDIIPLPILFMTEMIIIEKQVGIQRNHP